MQLFRNLGTFTQDFAQFLDSTSNCKHFKKKDDPRSLCLFEITDFEKHG